MKLMGYILIAVPDGYKEYLNYMECITPVHIKGTLIIRQFI